MLSYRQSSLLSDRFFKNLFPIPATNQFPLGTVAPPFELWHTQTETKVRLSDHAGNVKPEYVAFNRPVVIALTRIFTEQHYCPLCYPHIMALNDAYDQFVQRGAEILMITSTDAAQSKAVVRDLGLKMPLLIDPSCRVFRMYQVGQALGAPLPAQFVCDRNGRVRFRHLFSFIEPNASVERLLQVLDAL
jgi:peroxiredoxin